MSKKWAAWLVFGMAFCVVAAVEGQEGLNLLQVPSYLNMTVQPTRTYPEISINWDYFRANPGELPPDFKYVGVKK